MRLRHRTIGLVAAVALLGLAAAACTPETTVTVNDSGQSGIAVTGTGSVTVVPDIGVLNIGVEVTADTVAEARAGAAEAMEAIQGSLRASGVEDRDIATQFFNIFPQYRFRDEEAPRITGFTVNNRVTVKVRDIDRLSETLDEAIDAGGDAVRVNNVSFAVDEPEQYLEEARAKAVADGRQRAEQLATLAGVELGAPISINESRGGGPVPFPEFARADSALGGSTSIQPGENEITLSVSVLYEVR
jgi:uncharacterized protein YggE